MNVDTDGSRVSLRTPAPSPHCSRAITCRQCGRQRGVCVCGCSSSCGMVHSPVPFSERGPMLLMKAVLRKGQQSGWWGKMSACLVAIRRHEERGCETRGRMGLCRFGSLSAALLSWRKKSEVICSEAVNTANEWPHFNITEVGREW